MANSKIQARKAMKVNFDELTSSPARKQELKDARDQVFAIIEAEDDKRPIHSYVKYGSMGIEEVTCKSCGMPLRSLESLPQTGKKRKIGGKDHVVENVAIVTRDQYTEVTIDFDNGSHHVTLCCKDCAKKMTLEDAKWHYATDLLELDTESKGALFWDLFINRVPVAISITQGE